MRNILFFLLACFLCLHCKNECIDENIKLGDLSFDEATSAFIDLYEDRQSISFISSSGEIRVHKVQVQEDTNPILCVKVTCRPSYEVEGDNGCEYYDADYKHYILASDELDIHVKAEMKLYQLQLGAETEDYFEYIDVGLTSADTSFSAINITAANFEDYLDLRPPGFTSYFSAASVSFYSDYNNVLEYVINDGEEYIIYKKNLGIVNYRFDDEVWTLIE